MKKYWIFDRVETPQGFPLQKLLLRAVEVVPLGESRMIAIEESDGFGLQVAAWYKALETASVVHVPFDALYQVAAGDVEWFFNFKCTFLNNGVSVGIHDSTAMFIESTQDDVALRVASCFDSFKEAVRGPAGAQGTGAA